MIHLIVGNTGAGKTSYAQNLKLETMGVVFSIDTWNKKLFFPDKREEDGLEWMLERIERVEDIILDFVLQLDMLGTDAILDLGLSKVKHRQKFREFASKHQIPIKTHFLDVSKETRKQRVLERNQIKGETYQFEVTNENFEFMEHWFEAPTEEEMFDGVIVNN